MSTAASAVIPLLSVLLGGLLTYWLNVRSRKRSAIEDLFNSAISAVAIADASKHYLRSVAQPPAMTGGQYRDLLADIAKTAVENHCQRAGEAREALARLLQYESRVKEFYENAEAVIDSPNEIISILTEARAARFNGRRTNQVSSL